jgi:hypothetical protein
MPKESKTICCIKNNLMIELAKYKALTPESYGFINYSLEEVFSNVKIIESDSETIWDTLKRVFGDTFFHRQIQAEYSQVFSHKDQETLKREIAKINEEAQRNLRNITEKSEEEIRHMRLLIDSKEVEIRLVYIISNFPLLFFH